MKYVFCFGTYTNTPYIFCTYTYTKEFILLLVPVREAMAEQKEKSEQVLSGKGKQRTESLGWLTESSVMPKKQRMIEGVGASSIVELRAQLFRSQEDAKRIKEGGSAIDLREARASHKKKIDSFTKKNSGVEERATRYASRSPLSLSLSRFSLLVVPCG
jgi:hypothetical protein